MGKTRRGSMVPTSPLSRVKNDVLPKNGLTHTVLTHSLAERNERRPRKIISKIGCCTIYRRTGGLARSGGRMGGWTGEERRGQVKSWAESETGFEK